MHMNLEARSLFPAVDFSSEQREKRIGHLADQIRQLPEEALTKMYYFSGATGCPDACKMCSTGSGTVITRITKEGINDLVDAISLVVNERTETGSVLGKPYVSGLREFKPGHVLVFTDDDPSSSPHTGLLIERLHKKLGVKCAISTVGWSRHNQDLQAMHKRIARELPDAIREFRISFSSYPHGMNDRDEFTHDLGNMLRTYRPLVDAIGIGRNGMRVEIHYRPLVYPVDGQLDEETIENHHIIHSGPYMLISRDPTTQIPEATIEDYGGVSGKIPQYDRKPIPYFVVVSDKHIADGDWRALARNVIKQSPVVYSLDYQPYKVDNYNQETVYIRVEDLYRFRNADGPFYTIDPMFHPEKGYFHALSLYPRTETRSRSGVLDTTRFILNALLEYKERLGLGRRDPFDNAQWTDVYNVIKAVEDKRNKMAHFNRRCAQYLTHEIIPLMSCYASALSEAGYPPTYFFERDFTIDTGVIGNSGRALSQFGGLVSKFDEPIDPDNVRVIDIYRKKGDRWWWKPVPYLPADGKKSGYAVTGMKNKLGKPGTISVSLLDPYTFSPIPEQTYLIDGVPMEQVSYQEALRAYLIPGLPIQEG